MGLKIYIDDLRDPSVEEFDYIIINSHVFRALLSKISSEDTKISYISFDHDLGEDEPSGYDLCKYLVQADQTFDVLDKDFTFNVHSANPVGAENITEYMNNYLKHKSKTKR